MGLDMYLSKKTYVKNWDYMQESEKHKITVKKGGKPVPQIDPKRISYIVEEVAYWRKANAIHAWFVREVQDGKDECQESYVGVDQLKELISLCKKVLAAPKGAAQVQAAEKLLPPQAGFFFGSTEIDEYYIEDLEGTVKMLEPLLLEEGGDYYYRASW